MRSDDFGTMPDGQPVKRITIRGGGLTARFLTYGAVLQDLRLDGHAPALVLGFDSFEPYLKHSPYFGATAGRSANRIANATFELDGQTHAIDANFLDKHNLHGGRAGMGKRVWNVLSVGDDRVSFGITQDDGDMGFPGKLTVRADFALLDGGVLDIRYTATTDRLTICNLAHHSYFVLDDSGTILDHVLGIPAEGLTATDAELIPTGEIRKIAGTPYDFRSGRSIRAANEGGPIDTNFCVSDTRVAIRDIGWLESPASGVRMTIRSTEPGLQVYDAARIVVPVPGLDGRHMDAYSGLALEPQVWPDAIHHKHFPRPELAPGETYAQHTQFVFTKDAR